MRFAIYRFRQIMRGLSYEQQLFTNYNATVDGGLVAAYSSKTVIVVELKTVLFRR